MTKQIIKPNNTSRILYYDLLNIFASISVIFLHCNGISHIYSNTLAWKQAMLIETLMFWAVPVFFMLTGATLMDYRDKYGTKVFFKKRLIRTVIPFLIWSLLEIPIKHISVSSWTLVDWINEILLTRIENVYWFFIPLFSIYLCMPVLSLLTKETSRQTLWYLVILLFIIQSLLPPILSNWEIATPLSIPIGGGYIIYVILGYLLSTHNFSNKEKYFIYVLAILGAAFRYLITYFKSNNTGTIYNKYFDYLQFHSIFLAVGVFVLFKSIPWDKLFTSEKAHKIIVKLSSCSFGIYLIHMTIYREILNILNISDNCWQWRIFAPILIYILALLIVFILKKIPLLKHIVP